MNWKIFKFTLAVILLIIFTALAAPQLNFAIGDKQIYYPNIDFSLIAQDSKTGNFLRGRGIYPSKEVASTITFSNTEANETEKRNLLENYLQIVRNRISVAGLKDVEARSEISDSGYKIVINYPDYYQSPVKYTQWLTGKGNLTFASLDSSGQTSSVNLSDRDIKGSISVNFISQLGSHLQFQFDSSKATILTQALTPASTGQVGFFLMDLDNGEQFFVRQYEQNDATSYTVRAIPVNYSSGESTEKSIMLSIVRTYFLDKSALKDSFTTDQTVTIVPSTFSPDGTKFILIMSLVSLAVLILAAFIKLKIEGGLKFALMVGLFITMTITLLKYSNASLSIGSLIGIFFSIGLSSVISWKVIKEKDEDTNELNYKKFLNLSFVIIMLTIFLSAVSKGIAMFYDFTGVMLIAGLVLAFMSVYGFKTFNYLSIKRKK